MLKYNGSYLNLTIHKFLQLFADMYLAYIHFSNVNESHEPLLASTSTQIYQLAYIKFSGFGIAC